MYISGSTSEMPWDTFFSFLFLNAPAYIQYVHNDAWLAIGGVLPIKGEWCRTLVASLMLPYTGDSTSSRIVGELRHHDIHIELLLCLTHYANYARFVLCLVLLRFSPDRFYTYISCGQFYHQIPRLVNNYMLNKVWDEITYPLSNSNGRTVEVWVWISNFIPHCTMDVVTYPCLAQS